MTHAAARTVGGALWAPPAAAAEGVKMIDYLENLWALMSVFFCQTVVDFPLFQAMILFNTVIGVFYLLKYIFTNLAGLL